MTHFLFGEDGEKAAANRSDLMQTGVFNVHESSIGLEIEAKIKEHIALRAIKKDTKQILCCKDGRAIEASQLDLHKNGCKVGLFTSTPGNEDDVEGLRQRFLFEPVMVTEEGFNVFKIRCAVSNLVLDAQWESIDKNGCPVRLWEDLGGKNQLWYVEDFEGYQLIRNLESSLVLDAHLPAADKDGCYLQLWSCLKVRNQLWSIV
eukprot:TRINITY_DN558_c0_g1_i2.p1 TRINITY_DN558_c0_g1~~TRINITY_DN558_c0_g1_i2.p1  ORF type:complete len:204 (-),score=41.54 TRINITY_DN558_c0_g1_i2:100-711(-)